MTHTRLSVSALVDEPEGLSTRSLKGRGGLLWTVTAYTLTLASFILLGGSLGDRVGQRRIFVTETIWFTLASLAFTEAATGDTRIPRHG